MSNRTLTLPLLNAALYLATCALAGTGLLLELRMDVENGAVRLIGMGRDDWGEIHIVIAVAFLVLTGIHLLLNWTWIRAAVNRAPWAMPLLAVGLGLVAALLLWPADHTAAGSETKAGRRLEEVD
jgi:hypothetical protein